MTPNEFTNQEFFLDVGDGHQLYVQDWGNKQGSTPIIFLHGGPGSGVKDRYKATFDPKLQRVIFFDQRGCGKSLPFGQLENNTTQDLVRDIEKLADHLALKKFIITGGSWGSCLALLYTLAHPTRVKALVLRGIFTGTKREIDWIEKGHFKTFFPDVWQTLLDNTPKSHIHDPMGYHIKNMFDQDETAAKHSAYVYGNVESSLLSLDDRFTPPDFQEYNPIFAKIEAHYLKNNCFIPEGYILDHARELTMPVWLIQGRYDMVCPPIAAWELHRKLPAGQLIWTVAGHGNDRANYDTNRAILLQMADQP